MRTARVTSLLLFLVCLAFTPSAARAQCPVDFSNTGAACFRPASTISNGGSRVADCPGGYTNTGLLCTRPADSKANGSRVADCPKDFRNMGASCYRAIPPKSLSMDAMTCSGGEFRTGARCYKNCPAEYTSTGETCFRPVSTVGADRMTCGGNEFLSTGRCFQPCPQGYTNSGVSCFRPAATVAINAGIAANSNPTIANRPAYNIAHMVTTDAAVDWAVDQGANGLEMDLHFNPTTGVPTEFRHGSMICDCTCWLGNTDHVCAHFGNGPLHPPAGAPPGTVRPQCSMYAPAYDHLVHIATKPTVGFVYIDSKVDQDDLNEPVQRLAGAGVVNLLEQGLFQKGYKGVALIGAPASKYIAYLQAAVARAKQSPYAGSIYFGIDGDNGGKAGAEATIAQLKTLGTTNLMYGSGISSCLAGNYVPEQAAAIQAQINGDLHMSAIWSLDKEESMRSYLNLGVRGLLTNRPAALANAIRAANIQFAPATFRP